MNPKPCCRFFIFLIICFLIVLFESLPLVYAQVPLYTYRTKNLRLIYYDQNHAYLRPHIARCFENSMRFHKSLFNYTPSEPVTVLLQDWSDYGTGGTNTIPWNYLNIGIEPFDYVYETSPANERMNWIMNHELVHVLATDKAAGPDRFFRTIFGGKVLPRDENPLSMLYSYWTAPRWYSPRWYHEGIAVFMETWMSGGIGRAQNGYDEMVFRAKVRDKAHFYDIVGLESEGTTIDFQIGVNSYLYGTRFVSYLAYHYGLDKLLDWYNRSPGSRRSFSSQFRKVYGKSLNREWSRWINWEHQWQEANLDSIRQYPVTPTRDICDTPLGSVSRAFYDAETNRLFVGILYPGQISQIASIDVQTGVIEKICSMPTPALYYVTSLAYDPGSNTLFYTTHNSSNWRSLNAVDVETGKSKALIKNARIGDLTFNRQDKSLWGVRHHDGYSVLVRIPMPYRTYEEVLPLKYGKDLFDIDISPDGSLLTGSLVEISGRQRLVKMDITHLLSGDYSYEVLEEFEDNSPQNFTFSPDGRFLYGTSYYTGVSNVFRHDFQNRTTDIMTNSETGYFRPVVLSDDSLMVFRYTGEGFIPTVIPRQTVQTKAIRYLGQAIFEKYPRVDTWKLDPPSPELIDLDTLTVAASGPYRSLQNIRFASIYPIAEGYKDFPAYGLRANFMDALGGIDAIYLTASYTPNKILPADERFHAGFEITHWNWTFTGAYNGADFYDLVGPSKTSRKGYSLGIHFNNYLVYDKPKTLEYSVSLAGYGGLEKLPDFQNVDASFDKLLALKADLNYSYLLRSLGAVEYEHGLTWQLASRTNTVNGKWYPRFYANCDMGLLLPINHSSLWFRSALGYSIGERDEPFANFYFGGFGNNWIDYQGFSRYRDYDSFPGVEINEIGGTTFGKFMVEWTLPPVRFRRFGIPSFYFRWARMALFSSGIVSNFDFQPQKKESLNLGAQIDFRLVTFSIYKSTFSLGYAWAFKDGKNYSREFMISLKIL
jgi:hypothetical protein